MIGLADVDRPTRLFDGFLDRPNRPPLFGRPLCKVLLKGTIRGAEQGPGVPSRQQPVGQQTLDSWW